MEYIFTIYSNDRIEIHHFFKKAELKYEYEYLGNHVKILHFVRSWFPVLYDEIQKSEYHLWSYHTFCWIRYVDMTSMSNHKIR